MISLSKSELNSVKTGLRNFFEERQIDSDGTLAIMSSDATTFDLNLKPVDGLTKPAAMCLQHIAGLVERLRRVDKTLSLAEGVLVPTLTEFLLSHESQHPRRHDAGSSVGRGGNTYPRSNHGSVHAGDTASSSNICQRSLCHLCRLMRFLMSGFRGGFEIRLNSTELPSCRGRACWRKSLKAEEHEGREKELSTH